MKEQTKKITSRRYEESPAKRGQSKPGKEGRMEEENKLKEFLHKLIEEAPLSKLRLIVAVVMEIVR